MIKKLKESFPFMPKDNSSFKYGDRVRIIGTDKVGTVSVKKGLQGDKAIQFAVELNDGIDREWHYPDELELFTEMKNIIKRMI